MLIEVIAYSYLSKTECGLGRYLTEPVNLAEKKNGKFSPDLVILKSQR